MTGRRSIFDPYLSWLESPLGYAIAGTTWLLPCYARPRRDRRLHRHRVLLLSATMSAEVSLPHLAVGRWQQGRRIGVFNTRTK